MRTKLDPKTLRWVSRKLRGYHRKVRALGKMAKWEETYQLGRAQSYTRAAYLMLETAKTIERAKKPRRKQS